MTLPSVAAKASARPQGWVAKMIHPLADRGVGQAGSFVSKTFELSEVRGTETLAITAWGLYRASINGQRVGEDVLTPGWTNYDARLAVQEYDVADLLQVGTNTIEISLADGWFRSPLMWTGSGLANIWGDKVGALAELRAERLGQALIATDGSWLSGETKVRKSGIYYGETFDARVQPTSSHGVEVLSFDPSVLIAQECSPVRELPVLVPIKSRQDDQGRTVHDFGQNIGGYVAFTGRGAAGSQVLFEHAEILDKDGSFYNVNYRSAEARVEYTFAGEGREEYRPTFTFQGFRYVRVTISGDAAIEFITARPYRSRRPASPPPIRW